MLEVGRDRLIDKGATGNIEVVQADAQTLPFEDNSIDCITIAFGLRNVTDKGHGLAVNVARAEARRSLAGTGVFETHFAAAGQGLRSIFVPDITRRWAA